VLLSGQDVVNCITKTLCSRGQEFHFGLFFTKPYPNPQNTWNIRHVSHGIIHAALEQHQGD